ncbi:MAG: serine hydrolase [Ignavibacteriales bacterium]|nr:serine hydrolase [Ignavibacteriales bacterium]
MSSPSLHDYLRGRLRLARRPGTRVLYSNIAFTLVAYLVEKFSGMPFKEYMRKNVFGPVEMRDTAFEPRADMAERLAIPYMPVRRRTGVFRPGGLGQGRRVAGRGRLRDGRRPGPLAHGRRQPRGLQGPALPAWSRPSRR